MNLTAEQIDAMEAGIEMDRLIAEMIFNYQRATNKHGLSGYMWDEENDTPATKETWGGHYIATTWPAYSTDIAAAWQVVEKINALLKNAYTTVRGQTDGWVCEISWYEADLSSVASSAPLAICRAALKSVLLK